MQSSEFRQTFRFRQRFPLSSLAACSLLVFLAVSPACAATEASARLTIEVMVVPTVQNRVAVLQNSWTVTSGSSVMFNFAPGNSQTTTSTIDVRTVPTETLNSNKEMSAPDSPDQSILQTLTVIAK